MMLKKDKVFISTMAGMIGTLVKDVPNFIFYKLGIVKYLYAHLAASAHIKPEYIYTPLAYIIGIMGDIITGGAIGIVAIIFFERFGLEHWWYKGLIIGNGLWLFALGVILNLGSVNLVPNDPMFRLLALIDHWLFGLVTLYLIKKWTNLGERSLKRR